MKTQTENNLLAFVVSECKAINIEERYEETLRELYGDVNVCGMEMDAVRVLKEMDPTAYRCGVNDWEDSEGFVEIEGDYYESGDVDEARDEFVSNLESEVSDLEDEIAELTEAEDGADWTVLIGQKSAHLAELEASVTEASKYSF